MDEMTYTLQELAELSGIEARTIRSYIERDLLPGPYGLGPKAAYGQEHVDRLKVLGLLRNAHRAITLDQIRTLLGQLTPEQIAAIADGRQKVSTAFGGGLPVSSALSYLKSITARVADRRDRSERGPSSYRSSPRAARRQPGSEPASPTAAAPSAPSLRTSPSVRLAEEASARWPVPPPDLVSASARRRQILRASGTPALGGAGADAVRAAARSARRRARERERLAVGAQRDLASHSDHSRHRALRARRARRRSAGGAAAHRRPPASSPHEREPQMTQSNDSNAPMTPSRRRRRAPARRRLRPHAHPPQGGVGALPRRRSDRADSVERQPSSAAIAAVQGAAQSRAGDRRLGLDGGRADRRGEGGGAPAGGEPRRRRPAVGGVVRLARRGPCRRSPAGRRRPGRGRRGDRPARGRARRPISAPAGCGAAPAWPR